MKKWKSLLGVAIVPMVIGVTCSLTSCDNNKGVTPEVKQHVDYAKEAKLWTDYKGHDFEKDGIGEVRFSQHIDGDTTHAYIVEENGKYNKNRSIQIRYLGIDTPESTGKLQKWGRDASNFTKDHTIPTKYKTLVLSSDYKEFKPCQKDANDRFLAYVWVGEEENCPFEKLKLLNLMIVQEGLSTYKGSKDAKMYEELFLKAEEQAKSEKLFLWSDEVDPHLNYSKGYRTTIKDIVEGKRYITELDKRIKWDWLNPNNNDKKYRDKDDTGDYCIARFDCTVAMTSEDNAYVYDDVEGHRYGMYIFANYKGYGQVFQPMNRISVCGAVTERFGSLQITDISYQPAPFGGEKDMEILERNPKPGKEGHKEYEPIVFESIEEATKHENINVVGRINNLRPTGYYKDPYYTNEKGELVKGTPDVYTVGMKQDGSDDRMDIRFEGGRLKRNDVNIGFGPNEISYKEFFSKDKTFDVVGPIKRFVPEKSDKSIWQIEIIKPNAVKVNNIEKIQTTNNLINGGNI